MVSFSKALRRSKKELFLALVTLVGFFAFSSVFTYAYFARDLGTKDLIMNRNNTGVVLTDRNDKPFFTFYSAHEKTYTPLSEISYSAVNAILVMEDKGFYEHQGFSIRGILRSILTNIDKKELASGGSTITQQLVKNALLNPQKSFLRKYQEIILAQELERRFAKNEILEMYLNSVYFGEGSFGIEEAAKRYFGKKARDLTLAEGSLLAALLPSPSRLSPFNGEKDTVMARQKLVLSQMEEEGYINSVEREQAQNSELVFNGNQSDTNSKAPHFAILVRNQLIEKFGEERISRSGFKVKTTIDLDLQAYAEEVVKNQVASLGRNRVTNGAATVIDPKTGEILALVGSKDWFNDEYGKFNVATSMRQPGSSFKPIVYITALEKQLITPVTILKDQPTTYRYDGQVYAPKNYDGKFRGNVTARRALANSLNVPAVEVMNKVGVREALEMAKRLGITTLTNTSEYGLSLVLGAGEVSLIELTNAYATFANGGIKHEPIAILEIRDKRNDIIQLFKKKEERVVSAENAFQIASILSDNKARNEVFGNTLTISKPAAVKTGTTENYKDAWTIGFTPNIAVGAWVGNNDGATMDNIAGSLGAAPIWRALMERYFVTYGYEPFTPPGGLVAKTVCGQTATASAILEFFLPGTEPERPCVSPTLPISPKAEVKESKVTVTQPTAIPTQVPTETKPTENQGNKEEKKKDEEND